MARITNEDCLKKISNHFELVLVASCRARQLLQGRSTNLERGNDKPAVIALREIAEGIVGKEVLHESLDEGARVEEAVDKFMKDNIGIPDSMPGFGISSPDIFNNKKSAFAPDMTDPEESAADHAAAADAEAAYKESAEKQEEKRSGDQGAPPPDLSEEEPQDENWINVLAGAPLQANLSSGADDDKGGTKEKPEAAVDEAAMKTERPTAGGASAPGVFEEQPEFSEKPGEKESAAEEPDEGPP